MDDSSLPARNRHSATDDMGIYSQSVLQPSSMDGYMQMLDRSQTAVAGWLRTKVNDGRWEDKWWELKDGVLRYAADEDAPEEEWTSMRMEDVASFRMDPLIGTNALQITAKGAKISLQAADVESMQHWLFGLQRSVAVVLMRMTRGDRRQAKPVSNELGFGHGGRRRCGSTPYAHPGELERRASYGMETPEPREKFLYFDERKRAMSPSSAVPIPIQPPQSSPTFFRRNTDEQSFFPSRTPTPAAQTLDRVVEEQDVFAFESEFPGPSRRSSASERRDSVTSQVTTQISATHGASSHIGARSSNQDRLRIATQLQTAFGVVQYYAIYDGHCGPEVASFAEEHLHQLLAHYSAHHSTLVAAAREAFLELDRQALALCEESKLYCGSTAIVSLLLGSQLVVATLGDSIAVLARRDSVVNLSNPHKPGREDERERIEQANGWVIEERELFLDRLNRMDLRDPNVVDHAQRMQWTVTHRVCGDLAVSRAFGDPDFKTPGVTSMAPFIWPEGHNQVFDANLIIADPEFVQETISVEDSFMLLACDGIWDVLTAEEAVRFVSQQLEDENNTAQEAAENLVQFALKLGSTDNVTVIVVQFHSHNS